MNQILVTEKLYVTPELRRKKKMNIIIFIISVIFTILLLSFYIYAEYDKDKSESKSKQILAKLLNQDNTTISSKENALIVKLTQSPEIIDDSDNNSSIKLSTATKTYEAEDGKTYDIIGMINIPKININYVIFAENNEELLKIAPCKFHGGNPNEIGNLCITGHNYRRKNKFFSDVPSLVIGDIVEITDLSKRTIQYEVYDVHTVDPEDRTDTTQKTSGRKEVTLVTCTNDKKQRVIVKCKEKI